MKNLSGAAANRSSLSDWSATRTASTSGRGTRGFFGSTRLQPYPGETLEFLPTADVEGESILVFAGLGEGQGDAADVILLRHGHKVPKRSPG